MSNQPEREESPANPPESSPLLPNGKRRMTDGELLGHGPDDCMGCSSHKSMCCCNDLSGRMSDEELLAKMKAHIKERKAVYDALADGYREAAADPEYVKEQIEWVGENRVIANSGLERLHTAESENKSDAVNTHTVINDYTNNRMSANDLPPLVTNTVTTEDKTTRYPRLESDHLEETAYQWSNVIGRKIHTALPGRLAIALLQLERCNYDHDCGGEGDYPRCKECRAVRIMRGLIVELGAHGIGSEGLKP